MLAASAARVGRFVPSNIGRELLFYQLRRSASVEHGGRKWVVRAKRCGHPRGANRNRFCPSFGDEQGCECGPYVVFIADVEVRQVDAIHVVAEGCLKNANTQRRDLVRYGCIVDARNNALPPESVSASGFRACLLADSIRFYTGIPPQLFPDASDELVAALAPLSLEFGETFPCFTVPPSPSFEARNVRHGWVLSQRRCQDMPRSA
jgi:hypothetical protein